MTPFESAQAGRELIETAIRGLLAANPKGLRNFQIAEELGLASPRGAANRNYLTWQILQGLLERGDIFEFKDERGRATYTLGGGER